jgi:hypothetical protein
VRACVRACLRSVSAEARSAFFLFFCFVFAVCQSHRTTGPRFGEPWTRRHDDVSLQSESHPRGLMDPKIGCYQPEQFGPAKDLWLHIWETGKDLDNLSLKHDNSASLVMMRKVCRAFLYPASCDSLLPRYNHPSPCDPRAPCELTQHASSTSCMLAYPVVGGGQPRRQRTVAVALGRSTTPRGPPPVEEEGTVSRPASAAGVAGRRRRGEGPGEWRAADVVVAGRENPRVRLPLASPALRSASKIHGLLMVSYGPSNRAVAL